MPDSPTQLSEHFSLEELTLSQIAVRLGRKVEATGAILLNLERLAELVLEPIRAHIGVPIIISSGYRPPWLNTAAHGSRTSDHMTGCAADISAVGMAPRALAEKIVEILPNLPIKQMILEFDQWVHVSVCGAGEAAKRQVLTARHRGTETIYLPGLQ